MSMSSPTLPPLPTSRSPLSLLDRSVNAADEIVPGSWSPPPGLGKPVANPGGSVRIASVGLIDHASRTDLHPVGAVFEPKSAPPYRPARSARVAVTAASSPCRKRPRAAQLLESFARRWAHPRGEHRQDRRARREIAARTPAPSAPPVRKQRQSPVCSPRPGKSARLARSRSTLRGRVGRGYGELRGRVLSRLARVPGDRGGARVGSTISRGGADRQDP